MQSFPCFKLRAALWMAAIGVAVLGPLAPAQAQGAGTAPSTSAAVPAGETAGSEAATAASAQRQYEVEIAVCNNANYPAPERKECIRDAGRRLDSLRGLPRPKPEESADGRAIVVTPSITSSSLEGTTTSTTADGRATEVVPATSTTPQ